MTHDDVLFGYRLRLFTLAADIGVRPACRAMGVHHSTYYRWKSRVDRWGLEALRVRERRRPRMPNQIGPHIEQRVLAFSLAHPGCGPRRIAAELAREKWGGLRLSEHGVWRVLRRHGLSTRTWRLALIAGYADAYERQPSSPPPERHIDASGPGEIQHRRIRAGRPTANGNVERLQLTILEECWRPAFARALAPKSTALKQDLEQYLQTYNFDRAHTGRLTRGRVPGQIVYGARKMGAAR